MCTEAARSLSRGCVRGVISLVFVAVSVSAGSAAAEAAARRAGTLQAAAAGRPAEETPAAARTATEAGGRECAEPPLSPALSLQLKCPLPACGSERKIPTWALI